MVAKIKAPVYRKQKLQGTVTDLTYQGMGVVKVVDYPLFIENVLPGEVIDYVVTKVNAHYGFGQLQKLITTSPDRVTANDRRYVQTGIAPLAHLRYAAQLQFKQKQVAGLFHKQNLDIEVLPTLAAQKQTGYRNKAQVPVQSIRGQLETGFYRQHSHQLVPLDHFLIQEPEIDQTIKAIRDLMRSFKVTAYDEKTRQGQLRHIMVRRSAALQQQMVVLVSASKHLPREKALVQAIGALPEVKSIIYNYHPEPTNVILGRDERVLWGQPYLEDSLLGRRFHISARSFYQVNHDQTEVLYRTAIAAAQLQPDDVVVDAYSGIGTIGISLADQVKQVREIEVVPAAIADAKVNAKLNGLTNLDFTVGKAEKIMPEWAATGAPMDVLFVDPPRKGLAPEFIEAVLQSQPQRIVYISCNPATLARDLRKLIDGGYTASKTQPVDMFPMTTHVESVTALTLNKQ